MEYKLIPSMVRSVTFIWLFYITSGSDELLSGSFSRMSSLPTDIYNNPISSKTVRTRYECAAYCIQTWGTHFIYRSSLQSCTAYMGFSHTHTSSPRVQADPPDMLAYQSNNILGLGLTPNKIGGGKRLNIFIGMAFPRGGVIVAWRYYCHKVLPVVASVWRPLGDSSYQYIGGNLLTPTNIGHHHHDVIINDQIPILAGDVIGLHYRAAELAGYGGQTSQGAIPADATNFDPHCCGFQTDTAMPQYLKAGFDSHESLVAGVTTVVSGPSGYKMAALLAYSRPHG